MLDLLRGRPHVSQAPAQVLLGLCQQARAQHTESDPQVRMFWVLSAHFFDHLAHTPQASPWQNWHAVVCARIMAAAPGLAPMVAMAPPIIRADSYSDQHLWSPAQARAPPALI